MPFDLGDVYSDSQGGRVEYAWFDQRLQSMAMAMTTEAGKYAGVGFTYYQVGRVNTLQRASNGDPSTTINTNFTLDLLDRVTAISHQKVSGESSTTLSQFSYTYDANGRVVASTGPEGSLSFALDANGQLLSVTGSRSEAYAFDTNGNRSTNTTSAGNLLLSDGQFSYTYDFEGNRKTKTRLSDGQLTEYFWDHRNQLTKALIKDANGVLLKELRFTYDVEGRRVGVWVDADGAGPGAADQVWTVYDGANPYMDFDGAGQLQTRYLYGPGVDELFARIGAGEDPQWYLTDRLGSVRQIVDGAETILDDIVYDSFGNPISESNPSQGDRFKFTGREFSPELGIYYYRARWYDPATGRFISQDPIGFSAGDPNLYRYVGNAPGDGTDPEGLSPWDYFQPWAAVQGVWEGGWNIGAGVFNFGKESLLSDIDVLNSTLAWASGERYGYGGYLSTTANSIQEEHLTVGEYYQIVGANVVTVGLYDQVLGLFELYYGQASIDDVSQRLGTAGLMQLCGAKLVRGKGPRGDLPSIEKPVNSVPLTQTQLRAINRINNIIKDHLTDKDITGALRDITGNPVPKPSGGFWNHTQEINNAIRGLRNQLRVLEGLNTPEANTARQAALDAIRRVDAALNGAGI